MPWSDGKDLGLHWSNGQIHLKVFLFSKSVCHVMYNFSKIRKKSYITIKEALINTNNNNNNKQKKTKQKKNISSN
jgi:hypothetical protein